MLVRAESGTLSGWATQGDLRDMFSLAPHYCQELVTPHTLQFNPNTTGEGSVCALLGGYVRGGGWNQKGASEVGMS